MKAKLTHLREFIKKNNIKYTGDRPENKSKDTDEVRGPFTLNGLHNFWLTNDDIDYGYKLYNTSESQGQHIVDEYEFISGDDLEKMFALCKHLYDNDVAPEPLEIFTYKTLTGIKMEKVDQNREKVLKVYGTPKGKLPYYSNMYPEESFERMFESGVGNFGFRSDGKYVYVSTNNGDLTYRAKEGFLESL